MELPDCGAKLELISHTRNRLVPLAERTDTAQDAHTPENSDHNPGGI